MDKILGLYANIKMLEQEEVFRHFFCDLSKMRQQKIEMVKVASGRRRSLGAWTLCDYGLRQWYGLRERDVTIGYGVHGKPFVEGMPQIHFNLSHSGEWVLAVFAPVEVGCDIQQRIANVRNEQIARRFFAGEEQQAYAAGMDFYRIWARKESYLKLTGDGMALDMRAFSVVEDGNVHFADHTLADYELAACYANAESLPVMWMEIDLQKLM